MRVTITANGYQGLKAEVAEVLDNGARVIVDRKGIDLAPRNIYFTWDAIKGGKIEMEAPEPAERPVTITLTRKGKCARVYQAYGKIAGTEYNGEVIRKSQTRDYTHLSVTRRRGDAEGEGVVCFHETHKAALNGNGFTAASRLGVTIYEITEGKIEMPETETVEETPKGLHVRSTRGAKVHEGYVLESGELAAVCGVTGRSAQRSTLFIETNAEVTCANCKVETPGTEAVTETPEGLLR